MTIFFRRRVFEVQIFCDLGAWRSLYRISLVASFLGSLQNAFRVLPQAEETLARARHYGCIKEMKASGQLSALWQSLHAARPDDSADTLACKTARAAGGPRLANLALLVGAWPEQPITGAIAHTPRAVDFWCTAMLREPVTGRLRLAYRGRSAPYAYENVLFGRLAQDAHRAAVGLAERQVGEGGTFQGWSEADIHEICSRFRFWRNRLGPKEFADDGYGYESEDSDDSDSDSEDDEDAA